MLARAASDAAHRVAVEVAAEVQQAAALGEHRLARGGERRDLRAQRRVGRELGAEDLREPAGEDQRAAVRGQRLVAAAGRTARARRRPPRAARGSPRSETRTPARARSRCARPRAGSARAAGSRGSSAAPRAAGSCGAGAARARAPRWPRRRRSARPRPPARRSAARVRGSRSPAGTRPEVALGRDDALVAAQRAEHRHAERRDRLAQQLLVVVGADAVEDDPGDVELGVERREAVHDRGRRARHRRRVDDEQHRRAAAASRRGRSRPARRGPDAPSKRPMTPSTTAMSAPAPPWRTSGAISSGPLRNASRLRPGRPEAQRVVARVDVVRADLEALHAQPARAQRADQPAGHGGLARRRSSSRRRRRAGSRGRSGAAAGARRRAGARRPAR